MEVKNIMIKTETIIKQSEREDRSGIMETVKIHTSYIHEDESEVPFYADGGICVISVVYDKGGYYVYATEDYLRIPIQKILFEHQFRDTMDKIAINQVLDWITSSILWEGDWRQEVIDYCNNMDTVSHNYAIPVIRLSDWWLKYGSLEELTEERIREDVDKGYIPSPYTYNHYFFPMDAREYIYQLQDLKEMKK